MSESEPQSSSRPVPRRKATMRLSQRELNRISLGVILIIVGSLGFLGYRAFSGFKANHDVLIAKENLHLIYVALRNYDQDWDSHLPPADHWTDSAAGYLARSGRPGGKMASLNGPGDAGTVGYVYNDLAAGYNVESGRREGAKDNLPKAISPSRLVLLIERVGAEPNAHMVIPPQGDSPAAMEALYKALSFPHGTDTDDSATTVVLYADGSVRPLTRRDLKP